MTMSVSLADYLRAVASNSYRNEDFNVGNSSFPN